MPTELKPNEIAETVAQPGVKACPTDLSVHCPTCGTKMQPEHAHYRCVACGYRDSCCM